ncbi:MAG: response regulator transcription factor [Nocardioidaceae bacterium]
MDTRLAALVAGGRERTASLSTTSSVAERLRTVGDKGSSFVVAVAIPDAATNPHELRALNAAGLVAVPVRRAAALGTVVAQLRPDLVLLDIAVCPGAVLDMLAELRTVGAPAVVLCGSLSDPTIRAALLCAGADDCLEAPYLLDELVARVRAVLRRTQSTAQQGHSRAPLIAGPLSVDIDNHSVSIDGRRIALTLLEFRLLTYLLRHRGVAMPRERLLADVWGYTIGAPETVTVHIRRLRAKIEVDPSRPAWIETVWGVGYRFRCEPRGGERTAAEFSRRRTQSFPLATAG